MDVLLFFRAAVGMVFVMFVPGFTLSWVFFPKRKDIDDISRIGYSFVLSITSVTLSVLFVDLVLGIDITTEVIFATLCIFILITIGAWEAEVLLIGHFHNRSKPDPNVGEDVPPYPSDLPGSIESTIHLDQKHDGGADRDILPEDNPIESPSGSNSAKENWSKMGGFSWLRGIRIRNKK